MTKTITTSNWANGHGVQEGDIVCIHRLDTRKWPRFVAWLLRRPAPTKKQYFKAGKVVSNSFTIEPR